MAGGMTLEELYKQACETPSDINEHLPTLRRLAEQCDDVTEFGTRDGVSTTALAASGKEVFSVDINPVSEAAKRIQDAANQPVLFWREDTLLLTPRETDLLFIDTLHTSAQVYAELTRHADKVRKYLVFHDTVTFGLVGEDGGPGLLDGIWTWKDSHPEWKLVEYYNNNNGLMVFERQQGGVV